MTGERASEHRLAMGGGGLAVEGLTVRFGPTVAVDDVSLAVAPGEIVALLGPSGCGKSTLLRAVAGLELPTTGRVRWGGDDLTGLRPDRRRFGLMFQDHALFPHRNVGENVAFGLKMAGLDRPTRQTLVAEALERVGLTGYAERNVATLSGGEAQRVALARALAPEPRLLMLDEPLGSLDRVRRDELTGELRSLLGRLGLAAIHVTHDQEEAYAVADRIVVMGEGRVVRDGAAAEVWSDPGSPWVARFLGHANVLDVDAATRLGLPGRPVVVREAAVRLNESGVGAGPSLGETGLTGRVVDIRFRGATSRVTLDVQGVTLEVHLPVPPPPGSEVAVTIDPAHLAPLT